MKKIILAVLLLTVSLGYSQIGPIDFETIGNNWTWATFEAPPGESDPIFSIVENPSIDAINGSATVAKIDISYGTTEGWGSAGCESMHGSDIGTFTFTESNAIVTMQVYQEGFASPVALKFANAGGGALGQVIVNNTIVDAWFEVQFDMSDWIGHPENPADQIIFYPSHAARSGGHVVYFDNISFGSTLSTTTFEVSSFNTYPNPTGDSWTVKTNNINMSTIEVFDVSGKMVVSLKPNGNDVIIDGSNLRAGLYFAQIKTANGSSTIKLIKK